MVHRIDRLVSSLSWATSAAVPSVVSPATATHPGRRWNPPVA